MIAFALLLNSCNIIGERIKGNGKITTKAINLKNFTGIETDGTLEVIISQDSAFGVSVKTDENLVKYITAKVRGNILHLSTENGYSLDATDAIKISVSLSLLKSIEAGGASVITTTNKFLQEDKMVIDLSGASKATVQIRTPEVMLKTNGASTLNISGECRDMKASAKGACTINAFDLKSETSDVKASGTSSVSIFSSIQLTASASGASNIIYKGNPAIKKDASGASEITKAQ